MPPIFIIGESIKGANYSNIVLPHLIREVKRLMGDEPFLFMKDGDPAHKANLTQKWLRDSDIPFFNSRGMARKKSGFESH